MTPCITALGAAEAINILHRDISFNNIMLDENGRGIVNDWDHAGKARREPGTPHKAFRTVSSTSIRCVS